MLLDGPSDDSRRLTGPVLTAGYNFFEDVQATDGRPLQEAFVTAVQQIVTRFAGNPTVLGYEAFNEPVVLKQSELDAFHALFADGVHAIDRDAPVLFEPVATRNETESGDHPDDTLGQRAGRLCAAHLHRLVQHPEPERMGVRGPLRARSEHGRGEQRGQRVGDAALRHRVRLRRLQRQGAIVDLLGARPPGRVPRLEHRLGVLRPRKLGFYESDYDEQPGLAKTVARPYPRAVAGDLLNIEHPSRGELRVTWQSTPATEGLAHEVSMSADYASGYNVLCDGVSVPFTQGVGRATFTCPAGSGVRTFQVIGTPAP